MSRPTCGRDAGRIRVIPWGGLLMTARFVCPFTAIAFVAFGLVIGRGIDATAEVTLTVRDTVGLNSRRPVTGGIPLAQGTAPADSPFFLKDDRGESVPCQTSVLARWKDGSVRWLLLDFLAGPPPNGMAEFHAHSSE